MKVLHVIPSVSAAHGGPSLALATLERELAARGIHVETATTDDDGPGRRNGKLLEQPLRENGVIRWYFRKSAELYKPSPGFARWIRREACRFDVLHIHALFSFTTTAAAWAAQRLGIPYVVRPLGALDAYGLSRRRPLVKAVSLRLVERPLLQRAAAVHFTSCAEAAGATGLGLRVRAAVIPLGVEPPQVRSAGRFAAAGPVVLFLSRLDPKKNLETLLGAVARLVPEFPDLTLLVAGAGEPAYTAALHRLAQSRGIAGNVVWAGHLEGEAKAEAFAAAQVFVLPSHSENFGIAAAEALSAGLPCVVSPGVAIAPQIAEAGAGIVVAPSAESIAAALRALLLDPGARAAMGAGARSLAQQRYSPGAMGRRVHELYSEIIGA